MSVRSFPVSIVILTLNEEKNLPACLASLVGCNDIVVLDSGSTDCTHDIAKSAGARVVDALIVRRASACIVEKFQHEG